MTIFIERDLMAPHDEECGFWHGGQCDCKKEMRIAAAREHHCHECDYVNAYSGTTPCNCGGTCICERLEGCPCVGVLDENFGLGKLEFDE